VVHGAVCHRGGPRRVRDQEEIDVRPQDERQSDRPVRVILIAAIGAAVLIAAIILSAVSA